MGILGWTLNSVCSQDRQRGTLSFQQVPRPCSQLSLAPRVLLEHPDPLELFQPECAFPGELAKTPPPMQRAWGDHSSACSERPGDTDCWPGATL